jgi:hypothetical protein
VSDGRLEILSQPAFTEAGRALLGGLWEPGQEGYEALWLGGDRPASAAGDLHLMGWIRGGEARARLAAWKPASGESLFMLYARAADASAGETAAFLAAAKAHCKRHGIASLTGPMQFSTWHPYRFISRMGGADFFPGEQKWPEAYHADFLAAGFADIAGFQSSWVPDLRASLEVGEAMGLPQKLASFEVKTLAGRDLPAMLPEIHRMSSEIFRDNYAFSPIGLGDFLALAAGDKADKGADSVLIAVSIGGKMAAFAYGYSIGPYSIAADQPVGKTAVLKTLGVLPEHRGLGLGYVLSYLFHKHWLERGHTSLIHAYMKTDNRSSGMSERTAQPFRTYALMQGAV